MSDFISRQEVDELSKKLIHTTRDKSDFLCNFWEGLQKLPTVTPQQKTGHWIEGRTNNAKIHNILCSRCFEGYPSRGHARSQYTREKYKYCPNCGAKMVEPQESEGKE